MRYAQLIMGPAGSGKSTYCSAMEKHGEDSKRTINVINLDPAAEHFEYQPILDIRNLIQVDDVMEDKEMQFGPNGALVFCMEYLIQNIDWLEAELGEGEDDYYLIDCPGQIELYTHLPVIRQLIYYLHNWNFRICGIFIMDAQFLSDGAKFISGTMAALSVMINLEIPHINILSKIDLLSKASKKNLENFLDPDIHYLVKDSSLLWNKKYYHLTKSIGKVLEDYSLVQFYPLDIQNGENISDILLTIDNTIQYGEDLEPKVKEIELNDE